MKVGITVARAQLCALVDRVEQGEEVIITRHDRSVARLDPVELPLVPIDIDAIRAVREATPLQAEPAEEFIRRLRGDARY